MSKEDVSKSWFNICGIGMLMGIADLIPGISGGTVAFLSGIYADLLQAIRSFNRKTILLLFRGKFKAFSSLIPWKFITAIVIGISLSLVIFSTLIRYLLNQEPLRTYFYAFFIGLVGASIFLCFKEVRNWTKKEFIALALGIGTIILLLSIKLPTQNEPVYDVSLGVYTAQKNLDLAHNYREDTQMLTGVNEATLSAMLSKGIIFDDTPVYSYLLNEVKVARDFVEAQEVHYFNPWLVCCGILAVSAMLLPGISGSYLMHMLGLYSLIIGSLADFSMGFTQGRIYEDAFWTLLNMGIGIVIGLVIFSRFLFWLLKYYSSVTIAFLCGIMIGALKSIWPFWSSRYVLNPLHPFNGIHLELIEPIWPKNFSYQFLPIILVVIIGFIIILLADKFSVKKIDP